MLIEMNIVSSLTLFRIHQSLAAVIIVVDNSSYWNRLRTLSLLAAIAAAATTTTLESISKHISYFLIIAQVGTLSCTPTIDIGDHGLADALKTL
jgi:hypothetical protein